jgi:hypothetical protein
LLADAGIAPEEILLVQAASEGSEVLEGANQHDIVQLMQAGLTANEALLPRTATKQMALFDRLSI